MEPRIAVRLMNLRRIAQHALDRGEKLDPRMVLRVLEGKAKA